MTSYYLYILHKFTKNNHDFYMNHYIFKSTKNPPTKNINFEKFDYELWTIDLKFPTTFVSNKK